MWKTDFVKVANEFRGDRLSINDAGKKKQTEILAQTIYLK